jgi:hypothetical protein
VDRGNENAERSKLTAMENFEIENTMLRQQNEMLKKASTELEQKVALLENKVYELSTQNQLCLMEIHRKIESEEKLRQMLNSLMIGGGRSLEKNQENANYSPSDRSGISVGYNMTSQHSLQPNLVTQGSLNIPHLSQSQQIGLITGNSYKLVHSDQDKKQPNLVMASLNMELEKELNRLSGLSNNAQLNIQYSQMIPGAITQSTIAPRLSEDRFQSLLTRGSDITQRLHSDHKVSNAPVQKKED